MGIFAMTKTTMLMLMLMLMPMVMAMVMVMVMLMAMVMVMLPFRGGLVSWQHPCLKRHPFKLLDRLRSPVQIRLEM